MKWIVLWGALIVIGSFTNTVSSQTPSYSYIVDKDTVISNLQPMEYGSVIRCDNCGDKLK